ncbi:lanthionine synthetase C family protein [Actinomadura sp. 3N407]|uniref:lanthionine synthetase C family protein n=1 Tax=Actinomadura sp. 3N407 TaxID=3457423 RepID=UPI003FCE80A6
MKPETGSVTDGAEKGPARVERVIAVAPRKNGTHLVQELMVRLGYRVHGESVPPPDGAVELSIRQRLDLARHYLHPDEQARLDFRHDREGFVRTTNQLWFQVAEMWQTRLAAVNVTHTELSCPEAVHGLRMHPDAWRLPFGSTPANICWTAHALDLYRLDRAFYREWQSSWEPRLLLNYRDPRDTVVSLAAFLSGDDYKINRQPESAVYRPILRGMPDVADRITYLLRDPTVPLLSDYEAAISLYHHPHVCAVSFEELVGPRGGGSAGRQVTAVRRVAEHVRADVDASAVAGTLFNSDAYSFIGVGSGRGATCSPISTSGCSNSGSDTSWSCSVMSELDLLPPTLAAECRATATMILDRLADLGLAVEAADAAERTTGYPVWRPGASLYSGASGSALAFAVAAELLPESADRSRARAEEWLRLAAGSTHDAPVLSAGLSNGTAGMAVAATACAAVDGRYRGTLRTLHRKLGEQVAHSRVPAAGELAFDYYDVISGAAGILGYLAAVVEDDEAAGRARDVLVGRLVDRCRSGADGWSSWRIERKHYPQREIEHELYPYGYVDLGLAHGITGPLAALSRVKPAADGRDGVTDAVRLLARRLMESVTRDGTDLAWPRVMPFDAAGAVAPAMAHEAGEAYCYGPFGVCSALFDAAQRLADDAVRTIAVDGFAAATRRLREGPGPETPGLCHGWAGLVLICRKFAILAGSEPARAALPELVENLLAYCDADRPLLVQDYKPREVGGPGSPLADAPAGAWIDHPGFLDGAAGVALTLLSVTSSAPPRWARALLVH